MQIQQARCTLSAAIVLTLLACFMVANVGSVRAEGAERVIEIAAKKFEYSPKEIKLKKGVPVVLELTSLDRLHGFNCPDLKIRAEIHPGEVTKVRIVPEKTGAYEFHCDIYCGEGHEDMTGKIVVEE